jgi:hypothetical protein
MIAHLQLRCQVECVVWCRVTMSTYSTNALQLYMFCIYTVYTIVTYVYVYVYTAQEDQKRISELSAAVAHAIAQV